MPDLHRIAAILAGTLPPDAAEGPEPSEADLDRMVARAVQRTYERDHPPPPLDRLEPEDRASFLS